MAQSDVIEFGNTTQESRGALVQITSVIPQI